MFLALRLDSKRKENLNGIAKNSIVISILLLLLLVFAFSTPKAGEGVENNILWNDKESGEQASIPSKIQILEFQKIDFNNNENDVNSQNNFDDNFDETDKNNIENEGKIDGHNSYSSRSSIFVTGGGNTQVNTNNHQQSSNHDDGTDSESHCDPKTPGYWKNHLSEAEGLLPCVHNDYDIFDNITTQDEINYILECSGNCSNAFEKLRKFLLSVLFNICGNYFSLNDTYANQTAEYWINHSIEEVENGESEMDEYYKTVLDNMLNYGINCYPSYHAECNESLCIVVEGEGDDECASDADCINYCGDGKVGNNELCELPNTINNLYCEQNNFTCVDKKLGTRDNYGDCNLDCLCIEDQFTYLCVKGECGAECALDSDCDDQNSTTIDTCNLETCMCKHEVIEYCGNGVVEPPEECELPNTFNNSFCSQTTQQCEPNGRKLGTRDAYGDCNGNCGCVYDPFVYRCVKGECGAECDSNDDCLDYCDGSVKHTGRTCGWCSTCLCSDGVAFDCNSLDGWYETSEKRWIDVDACKEKEQKKQEYRDYDCGVSPAVDCYYSVNETRWVDTGNTRNKPDGTSCDDGLWCTVNDVCSSGVCGGGARNCDDGLWCTISDRCDEENDRCVSDARDCSAYNIPGIATCDNTPDGIHFTWDFRPTFFSVCDEENDRCTTGDETITHTCSVENCSAECDATHGCDDNECSETYYDYCEGKKLVEYDNDRVRDSTTVTDTCANTCKDDCTCTNCSVNCSPPSTNMYCVKGECGAECDSNDDCKCPEDSCVGPDYYDYPDHATCTNGCTCTKCEPTIIECDPRCMGACDVKVYIGHDMNPHWGYPYTATDDIYIVAMDSSNGQCNGLTIPIYYWWCSCPSQHPEQRAIEATRSDWSAKYDRLCTADAAYYNGQNPTHSLECGNCELRKYYAKFPEANGKKFWTVVGNCQGTFQVDIYKKDACYTRISELENYKAYALACAGQCEDYPQHMECRDMMCIAVEDYGKDECNSDDDCYYYACDYSLGRCVKTPGTQADECLSDNECVTYHMECNNFNNCISVQGPGPDECASNEDCWDIGILP
jgi:hypothetical protein